MNPIRCFLSADAEATRALGAALALVASPGLLLRLEGELGAGKTTLSQGIARGLGVDEPVTSPTFTLIREYAVVPRSGGPAGLSHMDFYRLTGAMEALDLGLDDYLAGEDLLVVEWPEQVGDALPETGLRLRIEGQPAREGATAESRPRQICIEALDPAGQALLRALSIQAPGLLELPAEACPGPPSLTDPRARARG